MRLQVKSKRPNAWSREEKNEKHQTIKWWKKNHEYRKWLKKRNKEQVFTFQSLGAHNLANRKIHSTSFTWRDLLFELLFQMFSSFFSLSLSLYLLHMIIFFFFWLLLQHISFVFYRLILWFVFMHSNTNKHTHIHTLHISFCVWLCVDSRARAFYIFAFIFGAI